jgi:hypothetical protein
MKISKKMQITFWVNLVSSGLLLAILALTQRMDSPLSTLGNIIGILFVIFYSPTIWILPFLLELLNCNGGMQETIIMLLFIPVNSFIWASCIAILDRIIFHKRAQPESQSGTNP